MQTQILSLLLPTMTAIFAAIFLALWWQDRARLYVLAYGYWFAAVSAGICLQVWIIAEFGPAEVLGFHALSSSGILALVWALANRDGERVPILAFIIMTALTGTIVWQASLASVQPVLLMAQNFNAAMLFGMGAYGLWQSPRRHWTDKLLLLTFVLFTSYAMFRPSLTILVQSQMTMAQYQASSLLTINLAMTAILCLLMSLALLATLFAERMEQERSEGTRDPLSGLPSRGAFEEAAQTILDRAQDERIAVSVILADIDHFKAVNDTWGHSAGDRVITAFGRLIASRIRPADEAGRVGGEEFCIFVWNCDESGAVALANRLRESFAQGPVKGFSKDTRFTASFGVAQWHTGETYKRVFKRADVALYQAKRGGRNSVMGSEADGLSGDQQADGVAALSENVTETAQVVPFAQFKHQST